MLTPGQNGTVTFAGTAGERISLVGSNGMSAQVSLACDVNVSILKPDGTTLVSPTCMEQSGFIDATTLPVTGTYSISSTRRAGQPEI
jgi:large repetitive protein